MPSRFVGAAPRRLEGGHHIACFGDAGEPLEAAALATLRDAVAQRQRMIVAAETPAARRLAARPEVEALIARGDVELANVDDDFRLSGRFDPRAPTSLLGPVLRSALADGYLGLCLFADSTPLVIGSTSEFATWIGWELEAEHLGDTLPLVGVCYFSCDRIEPERLEDLAVHPVVRGTGVEASFSLARRADAIVVSGALDRWCVQFRRLLESCTAEPEIVVDLGAAEFVDHSVLVMLDTLARARGEVYVRNPSRTMRKVWHILDLPGARLKFAD